MSDERMVEKRNVYIGLHWVYIGEDFEQFERWGAYIGVVKR